MLHTSHFAHTFVPLDFIVFDFHLLICINAYFRINTINQSINQSTSQSKPVYVVPYVSSESEAHAKRIRIAFKDAHISNHCIHELLSSYVHRLESLRPRGHVMLPTCTSYLHKRSFLVRSLFEFIRRPGTISSGRASVLPQMFFKEATSPRPLGRSPRNFAT